MMAQGRHGLLDGLAGRWEADIVVRKSAREHRQLVRWPTPNLVGIASLQPSCNLWCEVI